MAVPILALMVELLISMPVPAVNWPTLSPSAMSAGMPLISFHCTGAEAAAASFSMAACTWVTCNLAVPVSS